jgi:hypothetical protein
VPKYFRRHRDLVDVDLVGFHDFLKVRKALEA